MVEIKAPVDISKTAFASQKILLAKFKSRSPKRHCTEARKYVSEVYNRDKQSTNSPIKNKSMDRSHIRQPRRPFKLWQH